MKAIVDAEKQLQALEKLKQNLASFNPNLVVGDNNSAIGRGDAIGQFAGEGAGREGLLLYDPDWRPDAENLPAPVKAVRSFNVQESQKAAGGGARSGGAAGISPTLRSSRLSAGGSTTTSARGGTAL